MNRYVFPVWLAVIAGFFVPAPPVQAADEVRIYRCKIGARTVTQDKPCKAGQEISRQDMTRPRDPVAPVVISAPRTSTRVSPNVTYVINTPTAPARPVYQCISPEGERYTHEDPEGLARWVPAYGFPYGRPFGLPHGGRDRWRTSVIAGGMWVRDPCTALPQAHTCAILSERRIAIMRKNVALQASDRDALAAEAAGIEARLRADCNR